MRAHVNVSTWYEAINVCQQQGLGYVIITVLLSAGSTPREAGCKMIVSASEQFDTIGGGHLEHEAVQTARELLANNKQAQKTVSYPLSSRLGQCCGGAVKVLYEVHVNHDQHMAVFGAGHVAQSLVPMLAQLPMQISWVDSRDNFFNGESSRVSQSSLALTNVKAITNDDPTEELAKLPDNTWVIILTHNHQLDYELVETALKLPTLGFVGMIGSQTKAKNFMIKLEHRGFNALQMSKFISPIGDLSIPGKRPLEVSVSICAQLIRLLHGPSQNAVLPSQQTQVDASTYDKTASSTATQTLPPQTLKGN
jgi:xanthine dehydrogenase accessory factor